MTAREEADLERLVREAGEALSDEDLERFLGYIHPEIEFTSSCGSPGG